ncbi:hypothetical protein H7X46_25900 [Pseudonocardia sp. C8]|uniref:hypothetical protein n=1 Tax=Pseudonocardia sp. C8 TaxID=2762759 RepID=UPI001642B370|nr:hypothetical protein [Pseudonocardia sp. C8]MBC3194487.1 hypothetical protein [Pseudonocardia sp. C8]
METTGGHGIASRHWRLHGFWLAWFWTSWVISVVLFAGGVVVLAVGGPGPGASVTFGVAVVLVGLAGVIGWQLASTAVDVTLDADGTVVLRRQRGVVRTHVVRVRRLRRSALRSSFTPTVIETADGWAYLIHPRPERDDLVAALRRLDPDLVVEL